MACSPILWGCLDLAVQQWHQGNPKWAPYYVTRTEFGKVFIERLDIVLTYFIYIYVLLAVYTNYIYIFILVSSRYIGII